MKELLYQACGIALEAGKSIMDIYGREFTQSEKDDKSPLTEADLASHHIIVNGLSAMSELPILSEEGEIPNWDIRKEWKEYWIIDPLDGTKEFIKRNGEFTVNIALVKGGVPILGVVYAPALDILYFAAKDIGSFKLDYATKQRYEFASSISVSNKICDVRRVVGSRSHGSEKMEAFLKSLGEHELLPMGSSLKLCLVAEGQADLYPRLAPTSEWDTAAAHAVVLEAGGIVLQEDLVPLTYNKTETILNSNFIVSSQKDRTWASFFYEKVQ